MPTSTAATGLPTIGATQFITMIMQPAMSAAMEPTERSMPPEMMTKHMPTAMMPMKAVRVSTFIALSQVAKSGLSKVPAMHSNTRPTMGPASRRNCRRGWRPWVGGASTA